MKKKEVRMRQLKVVSEEGMTLAHFRFDRKLVKWFNVEVSTGAVLEVSEQTLINALLSMGKSRDEAWVLLKKTSSKRGRNQLSIADNFICSA